MILALYLTVVLLGAGATYVYAVQEAGVPFTPTVGFTAWAIAALQARNVVVYHQDGTSTTVGSVPFQYLCLGLAAISLFVIVLWYFDEYPDDEDQPTPDGTPHQEGL